MEQNIKYLDYEGLGTLVANIKSELNSLKLNVVELLNEIEVNDGKLTIKINNVKADDFTANQVGNTEINIPIPQSLSDFDEEQVISFIKNIIKYGQPDVSELTEEQKEALHELTAENYGYVSLDQLDNVLSESVADVKYNPTSKYILLFDSDNNPIGNGFDASIFMLDSIIDSITLADGTGDNLGSKVLLILFTTSLGVEQTEIPVDNLFSLDDYTKTNDLATVALTGDYSDVLNTPSTMTQSEANTGTKTGGELISPKVLKDTINSSLYGNSNPSEVTNITSDNISNYLSGYAKSIQVGQSTPTPADSNGVLFVPSLVLVDWSESNIDSKAFIKNKPRVYNLSEILDLIHYGTVNPDGNTPVIIPTSPLADVAYSGEYNDLLNTPNILTELDIKNIIKYGESDVDEMTPQEKEQAEALNGYAKKSELANVAFSGSYNDLQNKPTLFSGDYNDLTNKPSIPPTITVDNAFSKVSTNPVLNKTITEYIEDTLPTTIENIIKYGTTDIDGLTNEELEDLLNDSDFALKSDLFSGSYNDLTDKPNLFSGSYNDLTNKPSIPDAQILSDWNQTDNTAKDFIKNKPTIPDSPIQSNWNESDNTNLAYILNKPRVYTEQEIKNIVKYGLPDIIGLTSELLQLSILNNGNSYSNLVYSKSEIVTNGGQLTLDGSINILDIELNGNVSGVTFSTVPLNYHSCHLFVRSEIDPASILISDGSTVTIDGTTYTFVCPNGDVDLEIGTEGYLEFDIIRLDNELFVRGV